MRLAVLPTLLAMAIVSFSELKEQPRQPKPCPGYIDMGKIEWKAGAYGSAETLAVVINSCEKRNANDPTARKDCDDAREDLCKTVADLDDDSTPGFVRLPEGAVSEVRGLCGVTPENSSEN